MPEIRTGKKHLPALAKDGAKFQFSEYAPLLSEGMERDSSALYLPLYTPKKKGIPA